MTSSMPRRTQSQGSPASPSRSTLESSSSSSDSGGGHKPPRRTHSAPLVRPKLEWEDSIRHHVTFTERRFDTSTLPADLQRVYRQLEADNGEEYALTFVFLVRTAIELHRAWHMTLLTSKILQQVKEAFQLRTTWNLGVIKLIFRVEDGGFELHRRVPYDYDSEFQDLYMKIAVALVEGHISIHEALIFQTETKQGLHTAPSGQFLREWPGRLVLYPLESATCAVIFFGGDGWDAGVAAITGMAAGLLEYGINVLADKTGADQVRITVDFVVGTATGIIAGLFYQYQTTPAGGNQFCLEAIFLGTLYWFFYGTAFVIGLLEIIAGELETGVTRFIAVSVKTFVLSLGSAVGLMIAVEGNVYEAWTGSFDQCGLVQLNDKWWRIPLYLLCSASALGQYRFPIANYWRGLIVQLVGYEVQYQMFQYFGRRHARDFLDTASSNITGAAAAVLAASILSFLCDEVGKIYNGRLLMRNQNHNNTNNNQSSNSNSSSSHTHNNPFGTAMYGISKGWVKLVHCLGLGKQSYIKVLQMEKELYQNARELHDENHPRKEIRLEPDQEAALVEAIVEAEDLNIWALLMPAVYQLVPGSLIARLWYNTIFPPKLDEHIREIVLSDGTIATVKDLATNPLTDEVFYGLWVVSTSLALGLVLGFALVQIVNLIMRIPYYHLVAKKAQEDLTDEQIIAEEMRQARQRNRQQGVMDQQEKDDDPDDKTKAGQVTEGAAVADSAVVTSTHRMPVVVEEKDESTLLEIPDIPSPVRFQPLHRGDMEPNGVDSHGDDNDMSPGGQSTLVKMQLDKLGETEGIEVTKDQV